METPTQRRATTSRRLLRVAGATLVVAAFGFYALASSTRSTIRYAYHIAPSYSASPGKQDADGFLVASQNCHIPDVDPRHESIRRYLHGGDQLVCSRFAPLTYTVRGEDGTQTLRVDTDVVTHYVSKVKSLKCCYSVVTRVTDTSNNESSCLPFTSKAVLAPHVNLIHVLCTDKSRANKKVYANVHAVVQPRTNNAPTPPPGERRLNVLLLGIDSMSRLNLLRSMPRTAAHLVSQGWLELRGYNKVGDNTLPNLMAVLTGMDMVQLREASCALPQAGKKGYDHCPFLWKKFKVKGYTTAYLEDENLLSTFNYMSAGFKHQPTDYYLHPLMVEAVKKLSVHKTDGLLTCLESTRTTNHFLKYTLELASAREATGLFALLWLNNFSHNNYNTPAVMDVPFFEFFHELTSSGALNDSLVIFLSDHGARFGKIRETYVGWLEERLPFLYIWVPTWFRERYPEAYQNLVDNGGRLTSPFDLHLTIKDVVDETVGQAGNGSEGCPTCTSLFGVVAEDRACEEAGISTHWCTCVSQVPTSTSDKAVAGAVQAALADVNTRLARLGNETTPRPCAHLQVNQVMSARIKATGNRAKETGSGVKKAGNGSKSNGNVVKTTGNTVKTSGKVVNETGSSVKSTGKAVKAKEDSVKTVKVTKSEIKATKERPKVTGKEVKTDDFVVVFDTKPGMALLDATVRHWPVEHRYQVMGMVSRINSIGSDGQCIDDKDLRLYCYCL